MEYKLFLDDFRNPSDCASYMYKKIGKENIVYVEGIWMIVRDAPEFKVVLKEFGVPSLVSLDHDLTNEHYIVPTEDWKIENYPRIESSLGTTGYGCAIFLKELCDKQGVDYPIVIVHSMNSAGAKNIKSLFI